MTYCLGIKLIDGLVGIADTPISAGSSASVKKKVLVLHDGKASLFIMTSGLRSVRDKAVHYFQELISNGIVYDKMYKAVNAFGEQIKRVGHEDREALLVSGYKFNLNAIVGGQLQNDAEHKLFMLYTEGNWVELDDGSPFAIISNSGQGKGILNRIIHPETTMRQALKAGFLSFDSVRVSSNYVEFPIDIVTYEKNSFHITETRYQQQELQQVSYEWNEKLKHYLDEMPEAWIERILNQQQSSSLNNNQHEIPGI